MKSTTIREARKRRRWTQVNLAAASGVDQSVISRLERGEVTNPNLSTVLRLAKALGLNPAQFRFGPTDGSTRAIA